MWAHWPGYDHECEVNLFIRGKDVLSNNGYKVSAEILKAGGADMELYYDDKLVTTFKKKVWLGDKILDKVWIDDMNKI